MAQEMMVSSLNLAARTRRIYVDNRLSLQFYYRTAANLLKQANIYRGEGNVVDLYVILLRFSSLLSDTIPDHRDYRSGSPWERAEFKRKLVDVLDELEALKPDVERELDRRNRVHHLPPPSASPEAWADFTSQWPSASSKAGSSGQGLHRERSRIRSEDYHPPPPRAGDYVTASGRRSFDEDLSTLSLGYQRQRDQAPSRHSVYTPNVWRQPNSGVPSSRAQYPIYFDASQIPPLSSEQKWHVPSQSYRSSNRTSDSAPELRRRPEAHLRNSSRGGSPDSGFDLALVPGSARPESHPARPTGHSLELVPSPPLGRQPDRAPPNRAPPDRAPPDRSPPAPPPSQRRGAGSAPRFVRQPDPPPTLAPMRTLDSLDHSKDGLPHEQVAGIGSGSPQHSRDEPGPAKEILHLHVSIRMMEEFLALSRYNTKQNLETCAVLGGFLKKSVFYVSTLIIPKQEATSDSCQTLNEEEIFDFQDKRGLFQLGWIHTHPTQTCFMSSIDLHTHYSYQIMLSEAIAIVMAPTDSHRKYGIFRLSDSGGIKSIQQCQERGFHPHKEPPDGSPIYEHCGHVYMSPKLKFDVIDLRQS